MKAFLTISTFLLTICSSVFSYSVEIGVMVLYHKDFSAAKSPQTEITSYIDAANQTYKNSNMSLSLKLLHSQQLNLPNSKHVGGKLLDQLYGNPAVWDLQDQYRPDVTVYITNATAELGGQAWFPKVIHPKHRIYESQFRAIATSGWQKGSQTFIHEIGHVLGAGHGAVSQKWDILGGLIHGTQKWHGGIPYSYSVGHGLHNFFHTIMAYPDVYGTAQRQYYISNPNVNYGGVPSGTSNKRAAHGMVQFAVDHVQYNSACYPAIRKPHLLKSHLSQRLCNQTAHCLKVKQVWGKGRGKWPVQCEIFDPN